MQIYQSMVCRKLIHKVAHMFGFEKSAHSFMFENAYKSSRLNGVSRKGKRLMQVTGVPRSGTTLLLSMIGSLPSVFPLSEPFLQYAKEGKIEFSVGRRESIKMKNLSAVLKKSFSKKRCDIVVFKETFRTDNHPHFGTFNFIKKNHESKTVDKTIVVIRDPRDVWSSVIKRHPQLKSNFAVFGETIHAWNTCVGWAIDEGVPFVKYEDLVSDLNLMQDLANDLGIADCSRTRNLLQISGKGDKKGLQGGRVTSQSVGTHKEVLDRKTCHSIKNFCEEKMIRLDYKI